MIEAVYLVLLGLLLMVIGHVLTIYYYHKEVKEKDNEISKLKNQKKSSEVRVGLIAEQMAPFLDKFPYNPKDSHFIGRPIDFIVFDEDGVHFVEVKSGSARLTKIQRNIKQAVENGKVSFEIYRIKGE